MFHISDNVHFDRFLWMRGSNFHRYKTTLGASLSQNKIKMNTLLKAFQTAYPPTKHGFLNPAKQQPNRKNTIFLSLCKSNDGQSADSPPPPEGDIKKQELLAKIAMIQTQKVRLTDYLDDRAAYLTKFAEEANTEIDEIAKDARKELEEAEAKIREKLDLQMQAFEENAESNRLEIEKNEKTVADFEGQIQKDRNEGLFFKNLGEKAPVDRIKAKEETEKLKEITLKSAGSNTRRNIYLALIGLVVVSMVESFISNTSEWTQVAVLGVILVALLSQLIYEQNLSATTTTTNEKDEQK